MPRPRRQRAMPARSASLTSVFLARADETRRVGPRAPCARLDPAPGPDSTEERPRSARPSVRLEPEVSEEEERDRREAEARDAERSLRQGSREHSEERSENEEQGPVRRDARLTT